MDEDLILREIVKSLAFEIEAVNQDNVLKWSTTNGTPLNVKVRVRNKDEPRLVQRGTMPVPRIAITAPEKLALVSSNQTILSFSVYLQEELERKDEQKRHSGFKLFNIGSCLGTYSDDGDEEPYLPSSSNQINALESNSSIVSSSVILEKRVSQVLSTSNTVPRTKKSVFGKCKPGGCLDPPFGEDNYSYGLANTDRQKNFRLELHELEDSKKTCETGECFDPHCSEEKYRDTLLKTDRQDNLGLKLHETADNSIEIRKKSLERSREYETFVQETNKEEGVPKISPDINARTSEGNSLKLKYSNSIITYPTDKHSKERFSNQIANKKISIKSNDDDSLRQSYEYPESYFVPPKDVIRYKEEERRYVRRVSTDQLSRSSKVAAYDTTDKFNLSKTLGKEPKHILQINRGSKDSLTEKTNPTEPQVNDIDVTSIVSINKSNNATFTQFSTIKGDISSVTIPTASTNNKTENLHDDISIVKMPVNYDMPLIRSTSREEISQLPPTVSNKEKNENLEEIDIFDLLVKQEKPSMQSISRNTIKNVPSKNKTKNKTVEDSKPMPQIQVNEEKLSVRNASRETISKVTSIKSNNNEAENLQNEINFDDFLRQQEKLSTQSTSRAANNKLWNKKTDKDKTENLEDSIEKDVILAWDKQILDIRNAQTQDRVEINRQPKLEKNDNMDVQIPTNVTQKFKNNGDEILHSKNNVTDPVSPILATTATFAMTEKQYLQYKDNTNVVADSTMKEKTIDSLSNPEGHAQETDKQELQIEPDNTSPDFVSSTENSDFDISSVHSMDLIREPSSTEKSNRLLDISNLKDKWVSTANKNVKEKIDSSGIKLLESTEKKSSAILLKKLFVTNNDSDYKDDVSKVTPLKRNTFTIIGSDTSLQKSEGIEDIPENITNAPLKTTDKTKSGSPGKARDNIDILNTIKKKSEHKIHTSSATEISQKSKQHKVKDVYSQIPGITNPNSNDQACIKDESTKKIGNVSITIIDNYPIPENAFNMGLTDSPTETLDTTLKSIINANSLPKQLPVNVKDDMSHTNVDLDGEPALDVQRTEQQNSELLDAKDWAEYTKNKDLSTLHQITLEKYSSQELLSDNVKHFDLDIKDGNNLADTYQQYKPKNKEAHVLQNRELEETEYMRSKITIDRKLVYNDSTSDEIVPLGEKDRLSLESIQKPIAENKQEAYPNVYDAKADLSSRQYDKLEITGIEDKESKTHHNGKLITETLHKPTAKMEKDLFSRISAEDNLVSKGPTSEKSGRLDSIFQKNQNKIYDTLSISSIKKLISENAHALQSLITEKNQGITEIKDGIYNEVDSDENEKSSADSFFKIEAENVQNLNAQVADSNKDIYIDHLNDKREFVHIENNERPQKLMTAHVEDFHLVMAARSDRNSEIKNPVNKLISSDSAKDDLLKIKEENVQHYHEQTADSNEHISSDQINDNIVFLDTQSIDRTQKFIPEHVEDLNLMKADNNHEKAEIINQMFKEMNNFNYSASVTDDFLKIKSENVQNSHAHTVGDIEYVSSSHIYHEKMTLIDTENNEQSQNILPEQALDFHSLTTDKMLNDKTKLNDEKYKELDEVVYNQLITDYSLNHAQTADVDQYISSDQRYENTAILDQDSLEPEMIKYKSDIVDHNVYIRKYTEQAEVTQNLTDYTFGLKEKPSSASKSYSPVSGYFGLISEVLSNISENTEGEEKHNPKIEVNKGISEDFAISDTKVYRVNETLNNELENIDEEAELVKSRHRVDDFVLSDKIDGGSYIVPRNSIAESFTSTTKGSDEYRPKEKIGNSLASMQFITHSSEKIIQRFDEYSNDVLNKKVVRDDVFLDNTIGITNQNSEYQSSKILGSINDSIGLDKDDSPFIHNEEHLSQQKDRKIIERQYQSHSSVNESKIDGTETISLKRDPVYLNMSFYSYMNDNNQRILQTHSPVIEQRSHDVTVTAVKTLIRHGNEIRIPVDEENDISLNILDKDVRTTNKGRTIESTLRHTRREKNVVNRAKRHEVLNKNLALIYEHDLIPLHNIIKDLTLEVNTLSAQQEKHQMKIGNVKRSKSLRLIPVVKRCGCRRI